jgi:hypothetical protein
MLASFRDYKCNRKSLLLDILRGFPIIETPEVRKHYIPAAVSAFFTGHFPATPKKIIPASPSSRPVGW